MDLQEPYKVMYLLIGEGPPYSTLPHVPVPGVELTVVERPVGLAVLVDAPGTELLVIEVVDAPEPASVALLRRYRDLVPGLSILFLVRTPAAVAAAESLRRPGDDVVGVGSGSDTRVPAAVLRLAGASRSTRRANAGRTTVLAIGAHPDDVELGVGGILSAHHSVGDTVAILTMSRGQRGGDAAARADEAARAAATVGARLFLEDLTDTEIAPGGDTVRRMEAVVREVDPTIVYVHSVHDRHQDHRAIHHAAEVASRQVPMLACYQSPSSTVEFQPNRFVSIDGFLPAKLQMLAAYASQSGRPYLDPEYVTTTARYWARYGAGLECEPLEVVRNNTVVGSLLNHRVMSEVATGVDLPVEHAEEG